MQTDKGHPSRDELLAMAFADDELAPEPRAEFAARLVREPELARLVVQYQRLELISRQAAPPEPMDHEWRRLAEDGVQRAGMGLGWALLFTGGVGLVGYVAYEIHASSMDVAAKLILSALLLAVLVLFLMTLRARLRTLPFDPYTEVQR